MASHGMEYLDDGFRIVDDVAPTVSSVIDDAAAQAKSWLGDYKVVTNKAGDNVFLSNDRLRKMRFDVLNPHGDIPHIHLEVFENGKWIDAILGVHRIYPMP